MSKYRLPAPDEQILLDQLQARLVEPAELSRFHSLLRRHHYLGSLKPVGERLYYAVTDAQDEWVGLMVFNGAAKHLKLREEWIGWTSEQARRRLSLVVNNSRFLLVPHQSVPNLGTKALRMVLDRLSDDWQARYGHPVLVVETLRRRQLRDRCQAVGCLRKEVGYGLWFQGGRRPQESPFYQLVERFYPEFEAVYSERYQERYGFWRPIIATAVAKFLECGDLKLGFARVRCPKCRHEMFVAFSCRGRCVCPSCHEKRALEKAAWVAEHVCADVPHRQFVFTIPKRLRLYFRYDRSLLGTLCQAAWRTVCTVYQATSGRPDGVPGMVGAIQTFGDLIHWHPHIHALVSEGVFLPDGTLASLPKLASEPFLKLWEQEVFAFLLSEGKINDEVVANIRSCKHSGFSVDQTVRLEAGDREGIQRLIQYFLRCPFSQARMIDVTQEGKVLYKTGNNRLGPFPEAASDDLLAGPKRNFQIFDPLDFLAEVTQHPPSLC